MSGESPSRPAVSGGRKSKENLSKIEALDEKTMFSTVFFARIGPVSEQVTILDERCWFFSEISDTVRSVFWYLHFQIDILRGVFDSCDAEVPRGLHILE